MSRKDRPWTYNREKWRVRKYRTQKADEDENSLSQFVVDTASPGASPIYAASDWDCPWGYADKLEADFYAAMGDHHNAFRLYSRLNKKFDHSSDSSRAAKKHIMISLVRNAKTPENIQAARELLQAHRAGLGPSDPDKNFLFPILDATLKEQSGTGDKKVITGEICELVREVIQSTTSVIAMPPLYSDMDLVTYFALDYGLNYYRVEMTNDKCVVPEDILINYVLQQPLQLSSAEDRPSLLWCCALWCMDKLQVETVVELEDPSLSDGIYYQRWTNNKQIFCTLWLSMLRFVQNHSPPEWFTRSESALGISPTELVAILVWAAESESEPPSVVKVGEGTTQCAAVGFKALLDKGEGHLWHRVLGQFLWMNQNVEPGEHENIFKAAAQNQLQAWVSQKYQSKYPISAAGGCADSAALNFDSSMNMSMSMGIIGVGMDMDMESDWPMF